MSLQALESRVVIKRPDGHLDPAQMAAYIERTVDGDARQRIERHLASCDECRAELVDATHIVATLPNRRRRLPLWVPAVAAAAVVLMIVWPRESRHSLVAHREAPVTATVAPRAVMPVGPVDSVSVLAWSSVPQSDRYRVRVFDADGSVLWERETTDTTTGVPASVSLLPGRAYFWKVEAQTGFGRSAATELIEFSVRRALRP